MMGNQWTRVLVRILLLINQELLLYKENSINTFLDLYVSFSWAVVLQPIYTRAPSSYQGIKNQFHSFIPLFIQQTLIASEPSLSQKLNRHKGFDNNIRHSLALLQLTVLQGNRHQVYTHNVEVKLYIMINGNGNENEQKASKVGSVRGNLFKDVKFNLKGKKIGTVFQGKRLCGHQEKMLEGFEELKEDGCPGNQVSQEQVAQVKATEQHHRNVVLTSGARGITTGLRVIKTCVFERLQGKAFLPTG